ncbi:ribosome maturation protein, partial [Xylaria nigripes]
MMMMMECEHDLAKQEQIIAFGCPYLKLLHYKLHQPNSQELNSTQLPTLQPIQHQFRDSITYTTLSQVKLHQPTAKRSSAVTIHDISFFSSRLPTKTANMTRGEATQTKVHYKGRDDDYIVFVDDNETYKKWLNDKSIPLAHFLSTFKVFVTGKQGTQGQLADASRLVLATEFNTEDEEEVIKKILQIGNVQESQFPGRNGPKNDSQTTNIVNGQPGTR